VELEEKFFTLCIALQRKQSLSTDGKELRLCSILDED